MRPFTLLTRGGAVVFTAALVIAACGDDDTVGPTAAFAEPADSAAVHGAVQLAMTADGITIEEAGDARAGAGHFHVIADAGCLEAGTAIGKDADHVHFGGGQSEGVIYLEPGDHELCLQVGDGVHSALSVTDTVAITVGIDSRDEWCEVARQLDELSAATDDLEEFAAAQVGFENMARLLGQLSDAIEFVDDEPESEIGGVTASPRGHVNASLAFGTNLARAFTTADSFDEAFEEVDKLYADFPDDTEAELPGGAWIEEHCGVDLED